MPAVSWAVLHGHPVLKAVAAKIGPDYPELDKLMQDMWETLAHSEGVGLAAPQVNKSIRLFIVDGNPFYPDYPDGKDFKQVFINAEILEFFGEDTTFKEGCLSVPNIYEEVVRKDKIRIRYQDENFTEHEEVFDGIRARIIQHEYDHLEGHVHVWVNANSGRLSNRAPIPCVWAAIKMVWPILLVWRMK